MDESKPNQSSDKGDEASNVFKNRRLRLRETHGLRDDIDVNTPINDVKGPNVFERVKEEFEAIAEVIQKRKEDKGQDSPSSFRDDPNTPISDVKGPNVFVRVKEEFEAISEVIHKRKEDKSSDSPSSVRGDATSSGFKHEKQSSLSDQRGSPSHHKETHGRGEDIDADIPVGEFKGPNIFHRAKEEIEAIVDTIHSKKESENVPESPKKDGLRASISKKIHKIRNRD